MMRALVIDESNSVALRTVDEPRIERATGICGTDIHIVGGAYPAKRPLILGHETTGEVLATGAGVTRFRTGDRVILDPTYFCGQCFYCLNDRPNYCARKST